MKPSAILSRHWPAMLIGSIWLWMFWPMISGQTVCGFRDSAYLYYPLFKWIDSVWASGEIPLWNPYCNYGLPVVGDGSSSVFYPGKLIFLCRFLSYPSRYGIYLSIHVLIAAVGAYRFARTMKANQAGATLAAISYAFGGSVLFQVTNVIYLVSAAWLPFALHLVWRGILGGDWRSTVWTGVICSLMILGGDPQMVYHVGLIAAVSLVFCSWGHRRWLLKNTQSSCHAAYRWLTVGGARLALMVIVTSCLAAIQILPTAHWAERSERAASSHAHNMYHAWSSVDHATSRFLRRSNRWHRAQIEQLPNTLSRSLIGELRPGSSADATYQFSQPPWSIAELFFPNVMGKPFPTHQRWSDTLPAAERIWTPSVYAGVLTVLLALSQFRLWGRRKRHVWLCRIGVFFAIASFGWFGVVWALNEVVAVAGLSELEIGGIKIGPQVGGLYWFMVTLLPKYFMFRYPAKLFVIASLMISILAGLGLSQITNTSTKRKRASVCYIVILGACCIGGLAALQIAPIEAWLGRIRPNLFFGPLDIKSTVTDLNISFAQPLIVLVIALALAWLIQTGLRNSTTRTTCTYLTALIVLLTAFDVVSANRWMLAEVDPNVFEAPTEIAKQLKQIKSDNPNTTPRIYRSFDAQARGQTWPRATSTKRLEEIIAWRRETLFPKHHLEHGITLLGSFGSVWPAEYRHLPFCTDLDSEPDGSIFETQLLGDQVCAQFVPDTDRDSITLRPQTAGPVNNPRLIRAKFSGDGYYCHFLQHSYHRHAWNEIELAGINTVAYSLRSTTVDLSIDEPLRLVMSTLHDSGWKATVENLKTGESSRPKIYPVDGLWLQLKLEPGHHQVTFTYSPREFWIGCWISGLSWLALVIGLSVRLKTAKTRAKPRT